MFVAGWCVVATDPNDLVHFAIQQDMVQEEKVRAAKRAAKPNSSNFSDLLTGQLLSDCVQVLAWFWFEENSGNSGAKPVWLANYRKCERVLRGWDRGLDLTNVYFCKVLVPSHRQFSTGEVAQVCNLNQNPKARAMVSATMPTLLRQGTMWLLLPGGQEGERWLLPEVT